MPLNIGTRIGAIQSMTESEVRLLGYGVYDGVAVHPEFNIPNPRMTLDDGRHVWGLECWWGGEDEIKTRIGNRTVVNV